MKTGWVQEPQAPYKPLQVSESSPLLNETSNTKKSESRFVHGVSHAFSPPTIYEQLPTFSTVPAQHASQSLWKD